jgi:superfamily I DNA/RNA helicase
MFNRSDFDTFIAGLKYPPNPFQMRVLESIAFGEGNIVVSALAGSGKTSLLVQTAHLFKEMGITSVSYLAFNKSIKKELNSRLPAGYSAVNSHSLGLQVLQTSKKGSRLDNNKWYQIAKDAVSEMGVVKHMQYAATKAFQALCSKVMLNNVNPHDELAIKMIAERYSLESVTQPMISSVPKALRRAREIWEVSGTVSFDEMLYLPVVLNLQPPKFDFFLVDEAQDLSVLQQELSFRSLTDKGRSVYVGDENQAIYAFSGADAASFKNIITHTKATVLPLNVCYRCPSSHLDIARKLVPAIEARSNAPAGKIEYIKDDQIPKLAKEGNLIMCRLTAPLVSTYFKLIQNRIKSKVMGKDIGAQLISIMDKVAKYEGFTYDEAIEYLERYAEKQRIMLMQRENNEQALETLNDQIETLVVCITNFDSAKNLQMLKDVLSDLFGDSDEEENWKSMVTLCTVHRAKGLEADVTFLLKPEKMPLTRPKQKISDYEQELNILYVALTRSKDTMYVCGELNPMLGNLREILAAKMKQDAAEPVPAAHPALPLQPALLELPAPQRFIELEPTKLSPPSKVGFAQ